MSELQLEILFNNFEAKSVKMGWSEESGEKKYKCFICGESWKGEKGLVLLREEVALSRICLGEKLQEVAPEGMVILLSPKDIACWMCAFALNQVDRLEHKLDRLKQGIVDALLKTRTYKHRIPASAFSNPSTSKPSKEEKVISNSKSTGKTKKVGPVQLIRKAVKKYACRSCDNIYATEAALLSHQLVKHPPKYLCHICDSSFTNETRYKGHMSLHLTPSVTREIPVKIRKMLCVECHNEKLVDSNFQVEEPYQCKECSVKVENKIEELNSELEADDATVLSDNLTLLKDKNGEEGTQFKCNDCGEEFEFYELPTHRCFIESVVATDEVGMSGIEEEKESFGLRCRTCETEFDSISLLRDHWKVSGHPRQVDTRLKQFNKITDKSNNTQKMFKVVKQKFQIRTSGMEDGISSIRMGGYGIGGRGRTSWYGGGGSKGGRKCQTCHVEFLSSDLLRKHSIVTGHYQPPLVPQRPPPLENTSTTLANISPQQTTNNQTIIVKRETFEERIGGRDVKKLKETSNEVGGYLLPAHTSIISVAEDELHNTSLPAEESKRIMIIREPGIEDVNERKKNPLNKVEGRSNGTSTGKTRKRKLGDEVGGVRKRARGRVTCWNCERDFRDTALLAIHRRRSHRGRPPYQCPKCPATFSLSLSLTSHTAFVHPPENAFVVVRE